MCSSDVIPKRVVDSVLFSASIYSTNQAEIWTMTVCKINVTQQRFKSKSHKYVTNDAAPNHFSPRNKTAEILSIKSITNVSFNRSFQLHLEHYYYYTPNQTHKKTTTVLCATVLWPCEALTSRRMHNHRAKVQLGDEGTSSSRQFFAMDGFDEVAISTLKG